MSKWLGEAVLEVYQAIRKSEIKIQTVDSDLLGIFVNKVTEQLKLIKDLKEHLDLARRGLDYYKQYKQLLDRIRKAVEWQIPYKTDKKTNETVSYEEMTNFIVDFFENEARQYKAVKVEVEQSVSSNTKNKHVKAEKIAANMPKRAEYMDWMDEARKIAEQCWDAPYTKGKVKDYDLVEAIAEKIAIWMNTSVQADKNAEYYKMLLGQVGMAIGEPVYTRDDGTVGNSILYAKLPEAVKKRVEVIKAKLGIDYNDYI